MGQFGQFLIQEGKLLPGQLDKIMEMQQLVGGRLGTNILELGLIEEQELLNALGRFRHSRTIPPADLRHISREVLRLVPPKIAQRHGLIPVERLGNTLVMASRDPIDPLVEDELGYLTSCMVRTALCLEVRLHGSLEKYYGVPQPARLSGLARRLDHGPARKNPAAPAATTIPAPTATPESFLPAVPPKVSPKRRPKPRIAPPEIVPAEIVPAEIQYIELDDDTKQRIYTVDSAAQTPAARLDLAAEALQTSSIRDEIGDVLLDYCRPYFKRRLLLIQRKETLVGWRGEGEGMRIDKIRAISIPSQEASVFLTLQQGADFWLGPLAPLQAHGSLNDALGDPPPQSCLVVPITLRKRVVCFFYGDNASEGVGSAPLAEIKRLATKAGVAFEVCILQNKIRTL